MAQVVLSGVGEAIGGPIGRIIGSALGRSIDQAAINRLTPPVRRGPKLEGLQLSATHEGATMPCVFGRARVGGQMIWAARFRESRSVAGGGKTGPRTESFAYSLSFAMAVGEGPIDGIGRVWADGRPLDLSGVTMRVHRGGPDQASDPLIEAVEGEAPAFRDVAYVVFEDLALATFGNRPPVMSFEVFRRPRGAAARLEDKLEGVCLIPGAGEFVLATEPVVRREGLTRTVVENVNSLEGRPDLEVSLDQLAAQAPNLKRVNLVVGWFGDDLRAGECQVRPGVESWDRRTEPVDWSVAGLGRDEAHVVSRVGGGPAYGGTPSDRSVRQAVAALKARGWAVTLYPFVFMDIAPGNGLPDPYGGEEQAPYPWRGRIVGRDGAQATADVAALFGAADGWGLRRLARHYAALAAETGADALLIGSEMRGLTTTRAAAGGYPAVAEFRALAAECAAIAGPGVKISYAADWSEYAGHRPDDGSGDVAFHLDPLWADPNIAWVGIDWYAPMGDWRGGDGGLDAEAFAGPDDPAYLAVQVAGGEGFDWFYASDADRAAQVRTPIVDGAHGEDWVFRVKDMKGWWSNVHHDRPGGVRAASATGWVPGMKPIRLTEFGCAAVDRGGNAPNLFQDPKSSENALPPHSTGARDDRMQRRLLEAVVDHYAEAGNNPVSPVYSGPMLEGADAWCWDARPWPAFPARGDVWADAGAWASGHWLNGRLTGEAEDLIAAVLERGGVGEGERRIEAGRIGGVSGIVIDGPMRTRDALEPLLAAFGLTAAERDGRAAVVGPPVAQVALNLEQLALPDDGASVTATRRLEPVPGEARVRFIDEAADYQTGSSTARAQGDGGGLDLDLPVVTTAATGRRTARRMLMAAASVETLAVALDLLNALRLEPGDGVEVEGHDGVWRVERLALDETPTAMLAPVIPDGAEDEGEDWRPGEPPAPLARPFFAVLDLPPLPGAETDARPLIAAAGASWRPVDVYAGTSVESLTLRARVERPATVGALVEPLASGPAHRWDDAGSLGVRIEGDAPMAADVGSVLAGANVVAIMAANGEWEVVQYRAAELIAGDVWRLGGLLRGQQGTDDALRAGAEAGALVVWLDGAAARASVSSGELGMQMIWRAVAAGAPPGGAAASEVVEPWRGVQARPFTPCHARTRRETGGVRLSWTARTRLDGDRWDGETVISDPERFRVRVLDGEVERRSQTVDGATWLYSDAASAADFPGGPDAGGAFAVAQWSPVFGWGSETRCGLV